MTWVSEWVQSFENLNGTDKKENPKTLVTEVTWKYSIEYIKIKLLNKNNKFKNNKNCQVTWVSEWVQSFENLNGTKKKENPKTLVTEVT